MATCKLLTSTTLHRSYLEELEITRDGTGRSRRDFSLFLLPPLIGVDGAGPALFMWVGLAGSLGIDGVDDDVGEAAAGESPPAGVANSSSL